MEKAYVYRIAKRGQIDSILKLGYRKEFFGMNDMYYGDGVYATVNFSDTINNLRQTRYGDTIIKNELTDGFNRFLLFDTQLAQSVYGDLSIQRQLEYLLGKGTRDYNYAWGLFSKIMDNDTSPTGAKKHFGRGRTAGLLQTAMAHSGERARIELMNIFKRNDVRGAVYYGNVDGRCAVIYNCNYILPVEISYDKGNTWVKNNSLNELKEDYVDCDFEFKGKFPKAMAPIYREYNGNRFGYSLVTMLDGKKNYVCLPPDFKTKKYDYKPMFSINFIDETAMALNNGGFSAKCDGFELDLGVLGTNAIILNPYASLGKYGLDESFKTKRAVVFSLFADNIDYFKENRDKKNNSKKETDEYIQHLGTMPSIYRVMEHQYIDSFFTNSSTRDFEGAKGQANGRGLYTSLTLKDAQRLYGHYGDTIFELKLPNGYKGFLAFTEIGQRIAYGRQISLYEQLKIIGLSEKDAQTISHYINDRNAAEYSEKYPQIKGQIYHALGCDLVLCFDFGYPIPYAYSEDGGRTFETKANAETINNARGKNVDVIHKYANVYGERNVGKSFVTDVDGEDVTFCPIRKDGRMNFINVQTDKFAFPIWFKNIASSFSGKFQAELGNGKIITISPSHGWQNPDDGKWYRWRELSAFANGDNNQINENYLRNLIRSTILTML